MNKTFAISALLCAMTASAFAQGPAPMSSASATPMAKKAKSPSMAASGAMKSKKMKGSTAASSAM